MSAHPVVLVGATATGKTALALAVATARAGVEIVSADAMMVYRGMDIGTAKPTADEQDRIPHHLIDVCDSDDDYTVGRYQRDARHSIAGIDARGHAALIVGGTGLYVRALTDGLSIPPQFLDVRAELDADPDTSALYARLRTLDPPAAAKIEPANRRRVVRALEVTLGSGRPFSSFGPGLATYADTPFRLFGLTLARAEIDARIDARYDAQMKAGLLDEVRALHAAGRLSRTARQALGYKELIAHLGGNCTLDDALATAKARTHRFARRQERWFRRDPRIRWLDGNSPHLADVVLEEWATAV